MTEGQEEIQRLRQQMILERLPTISIGKTEPIAHITIKSEPLDEKVEENEPLTEMVVHNEPLTETVVRNEPLAEMESTPIVEKVSSDNLSAEIAVKNDTLVKAAIANVQRGEISVENEQLQIETVAKENLLTKIDIENKQPAEIAAKKEPPVEKLMKKEPLAQTNIKPVIIQACETPLASLGGSYAGPNTIRSSDEEVQKEAQFNSPDSWAETEEPIKKSLAARIILVVRGWCMGCSSPRR